MWVLVVVSLIFSEGSQPDRIALLMHSKEQCEIVSRIGNNGGFDSLTIGKMGFFCYKLRE